MGVNGNGSYSSKPITPAAAGTYHGEAYFADYDGQNTSASSGDCNYVVQVLTALSIDSAHPRRPECLVGGP